jgi:signal transduction histidine kinase
MDTHERKILYYLLLSALLLATLFFVFFRNLVKHYKRNQWLHMELTTIELETLEKERQRVKADLHDELAPLLASTGTLITNISAYQENDAALIAKASGNINALIEKLRKISFDLIPTSLVNRGLIDAVEELVSNLQLSTHVSLFFSHPVSLQLPQQTASQLYRIISEALQNTIKHAAAENCNIHIETNENLLTLSIIDDGTGFKNVVRGNGLNNIALRTELLKGKFFLESSPGQGVNITIEIPVA